MIDEEPLVSVIIPVYNCSDYIQRCLDSLYNQTYKNIEIIAIDDGSTDDSLSILKRNQKQNINLDVVTQENHGQGYSRNRAIEKAHGEFILFVDSDDYIELLTIELAVARIIDDESDLVHFDWKFSSLLPEAMRDYYYLNKEPFASKYILNGGECDELLQMTHFFSVNNLYRKSFLDKHKIRYGENRVYEDNIFVTLAANRAEKISLIHSPLYIIQRNMSSSTRQKTRDDTHYKGFIRAVKDSLEVFQPRTKYSNYYLVKYFQTKFVFYYIKRVPLRYKFSYLKDYVDSIGNRVIDIPNNGQPDRILRMSSKYNIFSKQNYALFVLIVFIKTQVLVRRDKIIRNLKRTKHRLRLKLKPTYYEKQSRSPIDENIITFLGFDTRYTGNSRYLYDEIIKDNRFKGFTIKFITTDKLVSDDHRVTPNSDEYYRLVARSKYIVAESWVPRSIKKRRGMIWVQLWHGTPLKRMLFDSAEPEIMRDNPAHKINLYNNTQDWDYLLADSQVGADKFASAFLFPLNRILIEGYPRVEYLIVNQTNMNLKREIRKKVGLSEKYTNRKVVLYAPTWRDYNYGKPDNKRDYNYLLNVEELSNQLGDGYVVLIHDHSYLSHAGHTSNDGYIDASSHDSQDLLLIADYLVTDYSSILFDGLAIDLPMSLYVNDFDRYQKSRGVYSDIWADLEPMAVDNISGLAAHIQNPKTPGLDKGDLSKYTYSDSGGLLKKLSEIINNSNN